jgi:hypothetical protein
VAQGATGTANVIYSDWVQIKFVDFKAQLDIPKLTDRIHEQGEVVVFFAAHTASGASTYRLNYYANPLTWVSFYITVGRISFIAGDTYNTPLTMSGTSSFPAACMHASRIRESTRMITRLYAGITAFPSSAGIRDIRQNHIFC